MKKLRFLVLTVALLMTMSVLWISVSAATAERDSLVTIEFTDSRTTDPGTDPGPGPGTTNPGGGGGDYTGGGGWTGGGGGTPSFGDATVTILDPDVPLADLGPLPQTGGYLLIPLIFVTGGVWLIYVAMGCKPKESAMAAMA